MKILKLLIFIGAMSLFGILGVVTVIAKWGDRVKTETPKIETATNTHYLMPTFLPQAGR